MAEQPPENPFSSPSSFSDVVLVVEDKKLYVSKTIMALMSPVFDRMFYGEFKEKNYTEVVLPGKKHDEMIAFLLSIYPALFKGITKKTVEAVMMLANEYQVERIFDECVKFLVNVRFEVSKMVHFLRLSDGKAELQNLYDHFLTEVAKNYRLKRKEFDEISIEMKCEVLKKRLELFETGYFRNSKRYKK